MILVLGVQLRSATFCGLYSCFIVGISEVEGLKTGSSKKCIVESSSAKIINSSPFEISVFAGGFKIISPFLL